MMGGMSGPAASVLLRSRAVDGQVDRLLAQSFRPTGQWDGDWSLHDPAALGVPAAAGAAGPVGVTVRQDFSADPRLIEAIGFDPAGKIRMWAYHNRDADHLLLGHLCLALAVEFDALVHFGGTLVPFAWPEDIPVLEPSAEQRAEISRRVAHGMRKLPGRLYVVNYGSRDRPTECHIGDAEFLDGWLRHPRFRMIK